MTTTTAAIHIIIITTTITTTATTSWESLHRRLESVQKRRLDRINEIQRRKEEIALANKVIFHKLTSFC